jgi:hypothetical protein
MIEHRKTTTIVPRLITVAVDASAETIITARQSHGIAWTRFCSE